MLSILASCAQHAKSVNLRDMRSESTKVRHQVFVITLSNIDRFLADRTIGRAFGTLCRLSVCLSVCDVLY